MIAKRFLPFRYPLLILSIMIFSCAQTATLDSPAAPEESTAAPVGTAVNLTCPESNAIPVPAEFQTTYDFLKTRLEQKKQALPAEEYSPESTTYLGTELIVANGNRGEALLQTSTLPAVRLFLDRFQALGMTGISIQISDPLLTATGMDNLAYLEFFRQVVEEAHSRGLRVMAETGPVFPDPQFSKVKINWSDLGIEEYFQNRKLQLVLIAREIKPDYLSLGSEPETEKMLTGLNFSPDDYRQFIDRTVAEIGPQAGLLLGGGSGTWEDLAYQDAFLKAVGLHFLNIHHYPLAGPKTDYWDLLFESAALAEAAGRKVIIGETWLYKTEPGDLAAGISYQTAIARDAFSFWQPLDIFFIQTLIRAARARRFEYLSFYWSGYFFGYLDYNPTSAGLSPVELAKNLNQVQYRNLLAGKLSATGCAFREEIQSSHSG